MTRTAGASWSAEVAHAGFMGTVSAGPIYDFNSDHAAAFSIGSYQNGPNHYAQLNLAYRYSRWQYDRPKVFWKPLHIGLFLLYSTDQQRFFTKSPSKYPEDGYYEETALRGGVELGSTVLLRHSRLGFAMYMRILDNGIVATLNNVYRDLQYYTSTGLGLQYQF